MAATDVAVQKTAVAVREPHKLVLAWFIISSLVVCWDTGYIFARPHSFAGGKLHWIWKPYALYGDVDLIYSKRFYELHNGFTAAQGALNVVETILNFVYVYLAAFQPNMRLRAVAPLVGFSSVIMTFWKTALYWMQDFLGGPSGWAFTGHNKPWEFIFIFFIPNSMWLIVPAILSVWFGVGLAENLLQAAGLAGPAGGTRSRAPRKSVSRRKSTTSVAGSSSRSASSSRAKNK